MSTSWKLKQTRANKADVREAFAWYKARSPDLAARFVQAVDARLSSIRRNPYQYPVVYRKARRALVDGFPYSVYYVAEEGRITILACMHQRRDPQDWQERAQP